MVDDVRYTMSVPEAGAKYFDLSRGASYAAAARGDIPTIKIGRKLRVPIVAIERMLDIGKRDVAWARPIPRRRSGLTRQPATEARS